MATGTALEKAEKESKAPAMTPIARMLSSKRGEIEQALGKAMSADRVIQVVRNSCLRNNDLAECIPITVFASVMRAAALRLDLEPSANEAFLIPRFNKDLGGKECTFQLGYQGVRKLVMRTGKVAAFETHLVYANEPFRLRHTPGLDFLHEPIFDRETRGPLLGGYGYGRMKGGDPFVIYMTKAEIDAHRDRGKGAQPAWKSDYEEMAHKTLVIRLGKQFPKTAEMIDALAHEYDTYDEDPVYASHRPRLGNAGLRDRLAIGQAPEPEPEPEFQASEGVTRPLGSEDDGEVIDAGDDDEREPGENG